MYNKTRELVKVQRSNMQLKKIKKYLPRNFRDGTSAPLIFGTLKYASML